MATIERKTASTLPNLLLPIVGSDQVVMFRDGVVLGKSSVENLLASITDLYAAADGLATLDGSGKVPTSQIPDTVLGAVDYKGAWNATSNSPNLGASAPDKGDYYVVSTAGSTSLGGITDWKLGDWAIFNGSAWEKVDNSDAVSSVFGRTGPVSAQAGDYAADQVTYSNVTSGLVATQVQEALDELAAGLVGGGALDVQEFTSSGTWTRPVTISASSRTFVIGGGAGGSGGSGCVGNANGGGGTAGGGASVKPKMFKTSDLGGTESVTVAAAPAGGTAVTGATGNNGTGGGNSSFGAHMTFYGGGGGFAGTFNGSTKSGGAGGGFFGAGGNGGIASSTAGTPDGVAGVAGSAGTVGQQSGGGSGAGISGLGVAGLNGGGAMRGGCGGGSGGGRGAGTAFAGGGGVHPLTGAIVTGGAATGVDGTDGVAVPGSLAGTSGAGGGGNPTGTAGRGGHGGYCSGGGGGGSVGNATGTSGAGGDGGTGRVIVVTII